MRFNHYNVRRTAGMKFKLIEDRMIEEPVARAAQVPMPVLPPDWREKQRLRDRQGKADDEDGHSGKDKSKRGGRSDGPQRRCPVQKSPGEKSHNPSTFFLDAAIYVRLTADTPYVIVMHWLLWMQYAGVERVYMYDIGYLSTDKCVSNVPGISKLVANGFLIIKKWDLPKWPEDRQLHIWRDVNGRYPTTQWRMYLAIEEFIFSLLDSDAGFAKRLLERTASQYGVIQLQNFVYSGEIFESTEKLLPDSERGAPEKHIRRVADGDAARDFRTKYIAHMQRTCALLIHTARPCDNFKLRKPTPEKLRFNTYETTWRPDETSDTEKLVEDFAMAKVFRRAIEASNRSLYEHGWKEG